MKTIKDVQKIKIISWIQIIGGVFGLFIIAKILLSIQDVTGPLLLLILIGIILFLFSIYAGLNLLKSANKKPVIFWSVINQLLQVFQWKMLGYGLTYCSGFQLSFGYEDFGFKFDFGVFSAFQAYMNSDQAFYIKLNIIPVIIIILLYGIVENWESMQLAREAQK